MTPVAICGGDELRAACEILGLEPSSMPRIVLVDLRCAGAAQEAAAHAPGIPRVLIATSDQAATVSALGPSATAIVGSADPAAIGPLVARLLPRPERDRTRVVTLTAARGGVGRTLCAANLARRLARTCAVLALDATGTGGLGWWLRVEPRPWSELEVVSGELRAEHVELIATSVSAHLSVVGGPPAAPSLDVLGATIVAARSLADIVVVDAPLLADVGGQACIARSDRILVLSYADPASAATLAAADVPGSAWLIGSQASIDGAFRFLPRDEPAVGDILESRGPASGALGRAYDELADLLAIDAT
jgi:hypothetical protein